MKKTNLDIWTIQNSPEMLDYALDGVEYSNNNILITNCKTKMNLGKREYHASFPTAFYSEQSDRLILLRRDGVVDEEDLRKRLLNDGISFHEINHLKPEVEDKEEDYDREIWFSRDKTALIDALEDSRDHLFLTGTYYPKMKGFLELSYVVDKNDEECETIPFDGRDIEGVIVLEDKIVPILSNKNETSISWRTVVKLFNQYSMDVHVEWTDVLPFYDKPKEYIKKDENGRETI